jgi:hypothetical protein
MFYILLFLMNSFDFDKVHFNTGLLVKECFKRGINVIYL